MHPVAKHPVPSNDDVDDKMHVTRDVEKEREREEKREIRVRAKNKTIYF
jgi:hypothetical protein